MDAPAVSRGEKSTGRGSEMATRRGNLVADTVATGGWGGRSRLRARVVVGAVALGCAAALALGGLRAGDTTQSRPQGASQPMAVVMTVNEQSCIYAGITGAPGEGCDGATREALPVNERVCVYANDRGVPGEGCGETQYVPVGPPTMHAQS